MVQIGCAATQRTSGYFVTALVLLLVVTGAEQHAVSHSKSLSNGSRPSSRSSHAEVECPARTANYITHTLPQQCLKPNWLRSNESAILTPATSLSNEDSVASLAENDTSPVNTEAEIIQPVNTTRSTAEVIVDDVADKYVQQSHDSAASARTAASSTPADDADLEADSALDSAKFLSFEDWKRENLAKVGQSPENVGQQRPSTNGGRRRPMNVLDTLGDEAEIDIDFSGFGSGPGNSEEKTSDSIRQTVPSLAEGNAGQASSAPTTSSKRKDAGTTCKERFNYASFDCAATILKTNPKCKSSSSILVESKDSYMLNECSQDNKFAIVELCDDILIDTVVLANFEFFSSTFRTFRISVSDRYPVKLDRWKVLGTFEARNTREIQAFPIENPLIWARYLRIEFWTQYGNEFYCPVSLLRVHGTTMMEEFRHQDEAARGEDDLEEDEVAQHSAAPTSAVDSVVKVEHKAAPLPPSQENKVIQAPAESSQPLSTATTTTFTSADISHATVFPVTSALLVSSGSTSSMTYTSPIPPLVSSQATQGKVDIPVVNTTSSDVVLTEPSSAQAVPISTSSGKSSDENSMKTVQTPSSPPSSPSFISPSSNSTTPAASNPASMASSTTPSTFSTSTSAQTQPPAATPTTQESFFKSVHKRLQMLEANSTLSLQYIEEQSRILRDAFSKVEKRQMQKAERFLDTLNSTVLTELKGFRQQYDQLWQSTVIELELNRERHRDEMSAVGARLSLIADELVWQKRVSVVQSTLLLFCLTLVVFVRAGSTVGLEIPLVPQMLNRSPPGLNRQVYKGTPRNGRGYEDTENEETPVVNGVSRRFSKQALENPRLRFEPATPPPPDSPNGSQDHRRALSTEEEEHDEGDEEELEVQDDEPGEADDKSGDQSQSSSLQSSPSRINDNSDSIDTETLNIVRQTQSGPATPSGRRENQDPLDWSSPGSSAHSPPAPPPSSSRQMLIDAVKASNASSANGRRRSPLRYVEDVQQQRGSKDLVVNTLNSAEEEEDGFD